MRGKGAPGGQRTKPFGIPVGGSIDGLTLRDRCAAKKNEGGGI